MELTFITGILATYLDGYENILPHQQLLGIPTLKTESYYIYLVLQTLDIFLGNMQYTIIRQFRGEQPASPQFRQEHDYIPVPITSGSLYYEWRHHMTESLTLLTTRMQYPDYNNQWIYSKPPDLPKTVEYHTWRDVLSQILAATVQSYRNSTISLSDTNIGPQPIRPRFI